jgi:hypothetical protein
MKICIVKATKRIIEAQSSATAGTLIQNAVNAGYDPLAIEEREVDDAGYAAAKAEDPVVIAAVAAQQAAQQAQACKTQAMIDNLPSWQQVSDAIDAADTIAKLRVIVKKMARVEYWLARNQAG